MGLHFLNEDLAADQPQTHALVVGIGKYTHLENVSHLGLQQLTSPIASATAFAKWLIEDLDNPAAPLGSVDMLLSPQDEPSGIDTMSGIESQLRAATFDNIVSAFGEWYERCNHAENVAIFYFCGHGLQKGTLALLPQDFARHASNPWMTAINFDKTYDAMRTNCKANIQCFFIDTCRYVDSQTLETSTLFGIPLLQDDITGLHSKTQTTLALQHATLIGRSAYGQQNEISQFTSTVVNALNGVGAVEQGGKWVVTLSSLNAGINSSAKLQNENENSLQLSVPRLEGPYPLSVIHHLEQPPIWAISPLTKVESSTDRLRAQEARLQELERQVLQDLTASDPHLQIAIEDTKSKIGLLRSQTEFERNPQLKLTVHYTLPNKPQKTCTFYSREVVIGREKHVPVDLNLAADPKVSRPHTRLYYKLSAWWVEDLNSKRKTYLNGVAIDEATQLFPGNELRLGDTILTIDLEPSRFNTPPLIDFVSQETVDEFEPVPPVSDLERENLLARIVAARDLATDNRDLLVRFKQILTNSIVVK